MWPWVNHFLCLHIKSFYYKMGQIFRKIDINIKWDGWPGSVSNKWHDTIRNFFFFFANFYFIQEHSKVIQLCILLLFNHWVASHSLVTPRILACQTPLFMGFHIYLYLLFFYIIFPFRLLQNIEQSSLCYTVGPCWLF